VEEIKRASSSVRIQAEAAVIKIMNGTVPDLAGQLPPTCGCRIPEEKVIIDEEAGGKLATTRSSSA
jgi:hypothetical protein